MSYPADQIERMGIGGNKPPEQIALMAGVKAALAAFLEAHPVILGFDDAKAGAEQLKRAKLALKDLDAERTGLVKPLNDEVKIVNDRYKSVSSALTRVLEELAGRLDDYRQREEATRQEAARLAAERAAALEAQAREAERMEREARDNARQGEIDAGVVSAGELADEAAQQAAQAQREAAIAAKDVPVRIGTDYGRPVSARTLNVPVIIDPHAVLRSMGLTPRVRQAMETDVREWYRLHGAAPPGAAMEQDRKIS